MQEKKNSPKNWERETFFVREKYVKNGSKNDKFIVRVWIRKDKKKKRKMKGKMKSDIKVEGSGEMKRQGIEKG